jgi:hypothetical protein
MSAAPSYAFKEWSAIVAALGAGAQTIILRKGGIAEGRGGFDPARARRFWLFPTQFHAQREKLKPAAAPYFPIAPTPDATPSTKSPAVFEFYADLVAHRFINNWPEVAALDAFHLWTEATVRERFEWASPSGLHLLLVRVHRLHSPIEVPAGLDLGGCKSWVELPAALAPDEVAPDARTVLSDAAFESARAEIGL